MKSIFRFPDKLRERGTGLFSQTNDLTQKQILNGQSILSSLSSSDQIFKFKPR